MYLGFWRDVSMLIRLIPANSIRTIRAYWLKCTCRCQSRVYRLRWQVELTFRNWKSLLKINVLKGTRTERVQCIIYGRLITIIMLAMISSYASWYAEDYLQRELSLPKLINWLKRKNRLVNAVHDGTLEALLRNLRRALPKLLCKQQRKRRTSRQLIAEYEPYMEEVIAA